ncbi:MAG: hypothetical protein ACLTAI_13640 [Thomasclavelia sp.]
MLVCMRLKGEKTKNDRFKFKVPVVELIKEEVGECPVLLLDDVLSRLR